jgi:hypothetical protein
MRKNLLFAFLILCAYFQTVTGLAQVSVTATVGTPAGTYTTLGGAFSAINSGTHKGVITIILTGSTSEPASASLDSSGNPTGSSYTTISIQPVAATAVTVSGSVAGPLLNLNGADNVTIDGIALAPGGASLTISNTSTATTASTIKLINDASSNTVKNTTIRGAGAALTTGVVFFSTGLATGNDNNTFQSNDIDATGSAVVGLLSSGTNTSFFQENSGNTITNCWIHDYFNTTIANYVGLYLASGNTDWNLNGNSFYQSTPRTVTASSVIYGLYTVANFAGDKHLINGNFFGGTAAGASNSGGNMQLSAAATFYIGFVGFYIQNGGAGGVVDGNIVRNITLTSSSASSIANAGFYGLIAGFSGTNTFSNNQVSDISLINNTAAGYISFQGIHVNGRTTATGTITPSFTINNNTVSNITATSSTNADFQFYGLRLETSSAASLTSGAIANVTFNANGNTVNSFTLASASSPSTLSFLRGIGVVTNAGTAAAPLQPKASLTNNTIRDLVVGGARASYTTPTVSGIQVTGAVALANADVQNISGNTIYNLSATTTADVSNSVVGIIVNNSTYTIEKNRIYGLSNAVVAASATPVISGITVQNVVATSTVKNNFISVGGGVSTNTNIFGILNNVTSSAAINIYYNSVYITGISASKNSVGFYRGNETLSAASTTTVDIKDNIFYNFRSGGSGANYAIGSYGTGTWTSDYNVLKSTLPGTIAFWNNTAMDLPTYQAASGQDANSKNITVTFVDPATADLHLAGASNGDPNLRGTPIAGVTTDYDGQARSSFAPYMGADEASIALPVQLVSFTGYKEGKANRLEWNTASEINNKGFDVQRSADGKNFSSIGFISTKADGGNSASPLNYSFTDEKPSIGTNYYRLQQMDKDGRITYSSIVALKGEKVDFAIAALYPNPTKDIIRLSLVSSRNEKVNISVIDITGKEVKRLNSGVVAGDNNITVDVSSLASGTYYIRLTAGTETKTARIIKN